MTTELRVKIDPFSDRHLLVRPIRVMRRMKRRNRWVLRVVLAVPFLALVGGVVLTRTAVTRWLLVPQIEKALNMNVSAGAVYVGLDGKLVMEQAVFRLPGVDGPAGRLLEVARVEAAVDWVGAMQGKDAIRRVQMTQPVVTISQSLDDDTLNIGGLSLPASTGKTVLPTITATDASIELAEHRGGNTTVLKHIRMDGWLDAAKGQPDVYSFRLTENNPRRAAGSMPGFTLRGTITAEGELKVDVENFGLDSWPDSSMPTQVRELFQELDLAGEVPRARFTYDTKNGVAARLELRGVGMNVPVQASEVTTVPDGDEPPVVLVGPPPPQLRMHGVSGFVTFARDEVYANVRGMAENLPYAVTLRYQGVTADAPFTCELVSNDFRVDRSPRLLPFAPKVVKERLQTFSSPTARVNTRLLVKRDAPENGEPGEISVSGEVEIREGVAAFEGFPYEFQDIHGVFQFGNDRLEWVNVTGRSVSGAELSARGVITPLNEDPQADIYVSVRNAPIDEAMQRAFGQGRSEIIDALFSQERYDELRSAGLVQTPEEYASAVRELEMARQRGAGAAEIAALEARAAVPPFAFRGSADIDVHVHRPLGLDTQWLTTVDIRLPDAGLLPAKFPLPIRATNVRARVVNRDGELLAGEFVGLGGGRADVSAEFKVPFDDDEDQEVRPEVRIDAHDIPLDALLIHALPGGEGGEGVKRILRGLGVNGSGRGSISISSRDGGELGFDADLSLVGAELRPGGGAVAITDVGGRVRASESAVDVTMTGHATMRGDDGTVRRVSGPLNATIAAEIPPTDAGGRASYRAEVSLPQVRLEAPIEPFLRVFSEAGAARVSELREMHRPSGAVDLKVDATSQEAGEPNVTVLASGAGPVDFDAMGGRFSFTPSGGRMRIRAGQSDDVTFEDVAGDAAFDQMRLGSVRLAGELGEPGGISLSVRDGMLQSSLVAKLAAERLGAAELWDKLRPRGLFDADLMLAAGGDGKVDARGTLTPLMLTVRAGERDVAFERVLGTIDFGGGMGAVRQLALIAAEWSTTLSATWTSAGGNGLEATAEIGLRGERLTPEIRELLPEDVRGVLDGVHLHVDGPFQLKSGSLSVSRSEKALTRFAGVLEVEDASLDAGVELKDLAGSATIGFERAGEAPAKFDLLAMADRFETGGIAMTGGAVRVQSGENEGEILVPEATALAHGGRIAVDARVMPGSEGKRSYFATLNAAGLRLAPLLKDLGEKGELPEGVDTRDDRSRGLLEGSMSLQGVVGDANSRRGRGRFQIYEGRILNVPFMMRMVELSNLQLPTNAKLDNGRGRFFVEGPRITFEDLGLFSSAVQILGSGTVDWPSKRLDLRFDTRPARGIPILSSLVRGIRDELVTTTVTGTLGEPEIKLRQFPGSRRMLDRSSAPGSDEPPVAPARHSADQGQAPEGIRPTRAPRSIAD